MGRVDDAFSKFIGDAMNKKRICAIPGCSTDISNRGRQARYCVPCYKKRWNRSKKERDLGRATRNDPIDHDQASKAGAAMNHGVIRHCARCNKSFAAKFRVQKYCPACTKKVL